MQSQIELLELAPGAAILKLHTLPDVGGVIVETLDLADLVGDYYGAEVLIDFGVEATLVGLEIPFDPPDDSEAGKPIAVVGRARLMQDEVSGKGYLDLASYLDGSCGEVEDLCMLHDIYRVYVGPRVRFDFDLDKNLLGVAFWQDPESQPNRE